MAKLFAYQIGQNPHIQTDLLVDPQLFEDEHGCGGGGLRFSRLCSNRNVYRY
ncbi:hypothetical protein EB32_02545 [Enterococcus faecalis]|nr:hypothetical protein EB32_02545 [Enterococcus faecalis]